MDEELIGWKVVRYPSVLPAPKKEMEKAFVSATTTGAITGYLIDQWTYPRVNCGPLCLFKDRESAWKFFDTFRYNHSYGAFRVYKCLYIPSPQNKIWVKHYLHIGDQARESYLKYLPHGTVLAKCIKLLTEEVKHEDL